MPVKTKGKKALLSVILNKTPEGVSVYCPELDIQTDGPDKDGAMEALFEAITDYYHVLKKNQGQLSQNMRRHLEIYETKLIPALPKECVGCVLNPFESPSFFRLTRELFSFWLYSRRERRKKKEEWLRDFSAVLKLSES